MWAGAFDAGCRCAWIVFALSNILVLFGRLLFLGKRWHANPISYDANESYYVLNEQSLVT